MSDSNKSKKISEGIQILFLTAGAYLFSYYYELGYTGYFGIPESFIRISIDTILKFGVALIGIVYFSIPFLNFVPYIYKEKLHVEFRKFIALTIILLFIVLFQAYIFGFDNFVYWEGIARILLFVLFMVAILTFLFPIFTRRNVKGYMAKIEAQSAFDREFNKRSGIGFFDGIERLFGRRALLAFLFLIIGTLVSRNIGLSEAVKKREFLVTNTIPEMIVLRIYDDLIICSTFEKSTNNLGEDIKLINISDYPDLNLHTEDIGQIVTKQSITPIMTPTTPVRSVTPDPKTIATEVP